jgi:tetratricopeptide (TPR) repeat protein
MTIKKGTAFFAIFALILSVAALDAEAQRGGRGQQQQPAGPPPVRVGPQAKSAEEAAAIDAVQKATTAASRLQLADNFITAFPNSELIGYIQRFRMEVLRVQGKHKEAIVAGETALAFEIKFMEDLIKRAAAEQAAAKAAPPQENNRNNRNNRGQQPPAPPPLDTNSPEFKAFAQQTEQGMMFYYQNIMDSYQMLNDAPKTIEWAEKALGQDPEDLLTLLTISSVLAERPSADAKEKDQQMKRAEEYGKKALAKVNAFLSSPAAAQVAPDQKAGLSSQVHQTLGLVYLNQKKFGDSQKEYNAAIAAKKDDPVAYYRIGLAYAQDNKIDLALEALAKSVFLKGITETQARDILQQLYQNKNKSLEGLDAFIASAGQKIGQ